MKNTKIRKIILFCSAVLSAVFFALSLSSLYVEADFMDSGFHTPWFSWQVDSTGVYFLTAMLCLVTARLAMMVFHTKKQEDYEALIEG